MYNSAGGTCECIYIYINRNRTRNIQYINTARWLQSQRGRAQGFRIGRRLATMVDRWDSSPTEYLSWQGEGHGYIGRHHQSGAVLYCAVCVYVCRRTSRTVSLSLSIYIYIYISVVARTVCGADGRGFCVRTACPCAYVRVCVGAPPAQRRLSIYPHLCIYLCIYLLLQGRRVLLAVGAAVCVRLVHACVCVCLFFPAKKAKVN